MKVCVLFWLGSHEVREGLITSCYEAANYWAKDVSFLGVSIIVYH